MKAYNSTAIFNTSLRKKAELWYAKQLISEKQYSEISSNYRVNFYTPTVFVKIGLFIFTCFIILAALGIYSLLFVSLFNSSSSGFATFTCLAFAAICFTVLESFIKSRNLYNAGVDEALLYAGFLFLAVALYLFTDNLLKDSPLFFAFIALPFITLSVLRYADRIATLTLCICAYTILFLMVMKFGNIAKMIMPFVLMLFSAVLYFQTKKLKHKSELAYWKSCIIVAEFVALLVFYISCNYYVIRESSLAFFNMYLEEGQDIPLAFIFYILTATVPIAYIYFGLKQKDKVQLWSGLILLAASVITFKYYFSLGHPEITLTIAGIILIMVAYIVINYLKVPRHGITFEEDRDEDSFLKSNAEALIIVKSMAQKTETLPSQDGVEFGGGKSGGAGSGGNY